MTFEAPVLRHFTARFEPMRAGALPSSPDDTREPFIADDYSGTVVQQPDFAQRR
jgi:hypothetical protein